MSALAATGRLQREVGVLTPALWGPWNLWLPADVLRHSTDTIVFTSEEHAGYLRARLLQALRTAVGCQRLAMTLIGTGYRIQPPALAVAAMVDAFLDARHLDLEVCWAIVDHEVAAHARAECERRGLTLQTGDVG